MAIYPSTLPRPQKDSYSIEQEGGVIKTQMTSGLARHRRVSANPPSKISVKWLFGEVEYAIFEAWFLYEAKMGAEWFDVELLGGQGITTHQTRFPENSYKAVFNKEVNKWAVSAVLEVLNRPTFTRGALSLYLNYGVEDIRQTTDLVNQTTDNFFNTI